MLIGSAADKGRIINEDENIFRAMTEKTGGNLRELFSELGKAGEFTDDLSLIRVAANFTPEQAAATDASTLTELSGAYRRKDFARALQLADNVVHSGERSAARARILFRLGNLAAALSEAAHALAVNPLKTDLIYLQVRAYKKLRNYEEAHAMSRKFGVTGLGLTICRRLAEMMDGDIQVSSQPGQGSSFRVRIWLDLGTAEDVAATPTDDALPADYGNARVLVVEDQPINREIVEALLADVGITPILAVNGRQALDLLRAGGPQAFDLVLMDLQMPVMDGLTATRELRADSDFRDLPIIAMTAHTMAHEKEISAAAGITDHLDKPFAADAFHRPDKLSSE